MQINYIKENRYKEIEEVKSETDDSRQQQENDIYGSGELIITKFKILDENQEEKYIFTLNEKLIFRLYYQTFEEIIKPVFVVAIYKTDGTIITQLIDKERNFTLDKLYQKGFVDFKIDSLKIGRGEYLISIAVFHDMDLTNPIEQEVYCLHDRKYKFKIEQPFGINMDLGLIYQDFKVSYGS